MSFLCDSFVLAIGEDTHLLHASKGRAASRATSLSTKIERRLEKKRALSDKEEEAKAFASFSADNGNTDNDNDNDDDHNNENDDDDSGSDSDDNDVNGSDDSDLDTGVDIPLPSDDNDNDIEGDDDDNDNDNDNASNDSKESKSSTKTPTTSKSENDNDNVDDGLPADQISTKSHNRSGAAPVRVTSLDSKNVAAAPKQRTVTDFAELKLSRALLRAVKDLNFTTPTPVQQQVIQHPHTYHPIPSLRWTSSSLISVGYPSSNDRSRYSRERNDRFG
jgi:hypothetical protein